MSGSAHDVTDNRCHLCEPVLPMRLTHLQTRIIKEEAARVFGADATVWLFGSRVDDTARGGDIDLMIEADLDPAAALEKELKFHAALMRRLGQQRIDVIVSRPGADRRPVVAAAMNTGVRL